jgi:hypothetical protein
MSDHQLDVCLKVLDHLQSIIERLAGNSFVIKGWAVTLSSALLGFSVEDSDSAVIAYLAILPTVVFYLLDAYYLALERKFREKYAAAMNEEFLINMNITASRIMAYQLKNAALVPFTLMPYLTLLICEVVFGLGLFSATGSSLHVK